MFHGSDDDNPYAHITVERLYAELEVTELANPVGTVCEYSNYAQALLGHALGLAAGRPYSDLVLERICRPLGMNDSGFDGTGVLDAFSGGSPVPRWTGQVFESAGIGMSCTIADLLTYAEAAADPLQTPLAEAFNVALSARTNLLSPAGPRSEQGLGWIRIGLVDGSFVYFHNGGTGGFRSSMFVHAPTRTCVVALCNEAEVGSGLDQAAAALIGASTKERKQP
jgi:CubicO group peptidase (beta-lactamase class C family)